MVWHSGLERDKSVLTLFIVGLLQFWIETELRFSQRCSTGFSLLVIWWWWHFGFHSVALLRRACCSLPALVAQNTSLLQGFYSSQLSSLMLVNITMLIWLRNVAFILRQLFFFAQGGEWTWQGVVRGVGELFGPVGDRLRALSHCHCLVLSNGPASSYSVTSDLWTLDRLKIGVLVFSQVNPVALLSSRPIRERG